MTVYAIVPATREHVEELAQTMRPSDVADMAAIGHTPIASIEASIRDSQAAYAGLADGKVMCIFGHSAKSLLDDEAYPWLLASVEMPRHAKIFLRLNRQYITALRSQYRLLWGWVRETNTTSIRWLKWLGFIMGSELVCPFPGQPGFYNFHMEN